MFLRNVSARPITINIGKKAVQVKPGDNPAVEFSDEDVKKCPFIGKLIKAGILREEVQPVVEEDELDGMTKDELTVYGESLEIDVKSRWSKAELIDEIRKVL